MEENDIHIDNDLNATTTAEEEANRKLLQQIDLLKKQSCYHTMDNWIELQRRIHRMSLWHKSWNATRTIAAILILPLAACIFFILYQKSINDKFYAETVETVSACGVVTKVILPDSSVVWLNSNSSISYPRHFTGNIREVRLNGEAFFKVKANKLRRFTVVTPDKMKVSAYGTEFNVSSYQQDAYANATLSKGHIQVQIKGQEADLSVGQTATFDRTSNKLVVQESDIWEKTGWREGKIIFRRTGIKDIANILSRHYNVQLIVDGQNLSDYVFSATFTNENIEEILDILRLSAPMQYRIIPSKAQSDMSYPRKKILIKLGHI